VLMFKIGAGRSLISIPYDTNKQCNIQRINEQ
jgi:hypothetical protein